MSQKITTVQSTQKTLLSDDNLDYQTELDELKTYLVSEPAIGRVNVPRFGLFSLYGRSIPMYAYDHPALVQMCSTAFTDGQNVFYSTAFMEKILSDDQGGRNGMLFLTLHEIGHNMFRHFYRLSQYPADIANRAQDMSMNTRMLRDFVYNKNESMNSLAPLSPALACGVGFEEGDIEKYAHRSEEDIAREMMEEEQALIDALKEMMKNAPPQPGQQGQQGQQPGQGRGVPMPGMGGGQPGEQGEGGQGDSDPNAQGQGQQPGQNASSGAQGDPSDQGQGKGQDDKLDQPGQQGTGKKEGDDDGMGINHLISPDQFARVLRGAGLGHVIDKLNMPVDGEGNIDQAKLAKQNDQQITNMNNANTTMANIRQQVGDRTPGAHCQDYFTETLGKLNKPKIGWKTSVKTAVLGNGMKMSRTFEVPGDEYFIDPIHMGLKKPLYIGATVPSRPTGFSLVLLDTSASQDDPWIRESASEIFGLVSSNKQTAPDVVFLQIDTVIRGAPIIITQANIEKLIRESFSVRGRGGTSLTNGIIMAMECDEVKKRLKRGEKMNSMIYFTDLGDAPPLRTNLPANLCKKFLYVASPGTYNDKFANDVADYATVVSMGNKMEIDLRGEKPIVNEMRKTKMAA